MCFLTSVMYHKSFYTTVFRAKQIVEMRALTRLLAKEGVSIEDVKREACTYDTVKYLSGFSVIKLCARLSRDVYMDGKEKAAKQCIVR